jgi:phosphatidylserine decarboxylase
MLLLKKRISWLLMYVVFLSLMVSINASCTQNEHQPIVAELIVLLQEKPEIEKELKSSISQANIVGVLTLKEYYAFLDKMVIYIPDSRELFQKLMVFYYLIDQSEKLHNNDLFNQWVVNFAKNWGSFLDTTESAQNLETFYTDPSFHMDDYYVGPSGWLTFNQFFARSVKPGKRPIDNPYNDNVIVSPADSVFAGQWPINEGAEITVKGLTWSIHELLDGSPYQDKFNEGIFMHSFLNVNDYHRYHVPVGGTVKEVRTIPGRMVLDVVKKANGSFDVVD